MTKKILFLLTFLLTTLGGGNSAWAEDITYNFSAYLSGTAKLANTTNCTLTFYDDEGDDGDIPAGTACSSYYYSKMNGSANYYVIDGYKDFVAGDIVKVYLYAFGNKTTTTVACEIGKTTKTVLTQSVEVGSVYELSHTLSASEIEEDGTLRIYRNGGNTFFAGVSIASTRTIASDNTIQTYPYTWDFSDKTNDQWVQTFKDMGLYTTSSPAQWTHIISDEPAANYRPAVARSNWQYDVALLKGLKFNKATTGSSPCLDYQYQHLWVEEGTIITIPSVKAGQKIQLTGDVNISGNSSNLTQVTANSEYTVTSDGDVTLTFNSSWIKTLAVTKGDIDNFRLEKNQGYTYQGHDKTNTYIWPYGAVTTKNFNFKVSKGSSNNEVGFLWTENNTDGIVVNETNFSISSNNSDVISVSGFDQNTGDAAQRRLRWTNVTFGTPGTATVTFRFNGNDQFNSKTFTQEFTITKLEQVLTFGVESKSVNYVADGTSTSPSLTKVVNQKYDDGHQVNVTSSTLGGTDIIYSSSNPNVAEVNVSTGEITMKNAGVTTITATAPSSELYEEATASYELTVNGSTTPTLEWTTNSSFPNLSGTTLAYGNNAYCLATATGTNATVQYKSSNTKIATVAVAEHGGQTNACKITPTGNGEVTITAYVEGSGDVNPAEVSFPMTIVGQGVNMHFQPTSGTVKVGKTITPYISVPDIKMADITSVTVTTLDESKATVTAGETTETSNTYTLTKANGGLTSYTKDDTEYLEHIYATIKGEAVTSDAVTITVTVNSDIYKPTTATYQVTVNNEDLNFNWEAPNQTYTLYTGDYMMIPAITGNANGNRSYSKGSTCESEHAYLYDIKSGTPTWNNRDFKIGEGIPDYRLYESDGTTVTDKAYIVWVNGQSVHTDVLMIYAKTAGTVKLHAKDPQTGASPEDITIIIKNKSTLTSATTSYVNTMSFPYTWSFVGESSIATVSPNYWEDKGDYYTCGMSTAFNFDYCDEDNDGDTGEALKGKYFVDETGIMPQFYGMTVEFGNSGDKNHSYKAKEDKLRLYKYDSNHPDQPLLHVVGGTHKIALPAPGAGCPSNYKLFVKARSRKEEPEQAILQAYWSDFNKPYYSFTNNDPIIFSVDVTSGDPVKELWVSDVDIYWIAMSTEEKKLSYFAESNHNLTYAAAAYSYNEDLDLSKSNEVNGATAYYASSFTKDNDAQGAYTNEQEQQYAVVMKPLTNLGTYVTSGTGMLLKYDEVGGITADTKIPFYMIANPKNVATYKADPTIDGTTHKNYLVGTGATTPTIGRTTEIGGTTYTNFMMSAAYKYYQDISKPSSVQGDYRFDRNWSFYPVMKPGEVEAQKSYLRIPGNLYVNKEGKIVDIPASSRSYGRAADNDTPGAPASRGALSIVFDDDPSNGQGTTGISTVATEITNDSDAWFTLQGVRVNAPAKGGIYIHKGRKIVVK